jgi:competence protein ComEC
MVLYRSPGGKILVPGDAEDSTWDFVLSKYPDTVRNCSVLVAPHHGRHSDMDFSFLKVVNPKLVLMGCADSEDLAYDAYSNYPCITNNQAGNVIAECTGAGIDIYVENQEFAAHFAQQGSKGHLNGHHLIGRLARI